MEKIIYDIQWSDRVGSKFISDFISVFNLVFNGRLTLEAFDRKYIKNIYGPSLLVVVYIDNKPVAARALWRNDILGQLAFQPVDTCVLAQCRGKGVFTEMTKKSIALLPENAIIYNFPNANSYPGYMKMGWSLKKTYKKEFFSEKKFNQEHLVEVDEAYAQWWLRENKRIRHFKKGKSYYLALNSGKFLLKVIGKTSKKVAVLFPKAEFYRVKYFDSPRTTWYNKKIAEIHVVTRNPEVECIPVWKLDAI